MEDCTLKKGATGIPLSIHDDAPGINTPDIAYLQNHHPCSLSGDIHIKRKSIKRSIKIDRHCSYTAVDDFPGGEADPGSYTYSLRTIRQEIQVRSDSLPQELSFLACDPEIAGSLPGGGCLLYRFGHGTDKISTVSPVAYYIT